LAEDADVVGPVADNVEAQARRVVASNADDERSEVRMRRKKRRRIPVQRAITCDDEQSPDSKFGRAYREAARCEKRGHRR
jgi:hypothetical protein